MRSEASKRLTISVSIEPPEPLVLKNWDGKEFVVRSIRTEYYFRDGGFTRQRIEASGKKLKKDGTPSTISAKSNWGQEFSPEIQRRLRVGAESVLKAAAKAALS